MNLHRLTIAAACLSACAAAAAIPDYDIVMIATNTGNSTANDITPNGTVVGCYINEHGTQQAYSWKDGVMTPLWLYGCGQQANDAGIISGRDTSNIVIWDGTTLNQMHTEGSSEVNAAGYVLFSDEAGGQHMWYQGQATQIAPSCSDLNDSNVLLCYTSAGTEYLYQYPTGETTPIPPAADGARIFGSARLNDRGQAVAIDRGITFYSNGVTQHWWNTPQNAAFVRLNNAGLVVGGVNQGSGFIAEGDGQYRYFSSMPAVQAGGWTLVTPTGINDNGWISANALDRNGVQRALLLVPHTTDTTQPPLARKIASRYDFNGDARGDLLWRSSAGQYGIWLMNGQSVTYTGALETPPGATLVSKADFNVDGHTDLVFRDSAGGYYVEIVLAPTSVVIQKVLEPGSGWELAGVGDFNGDFKSDLLWWHPDHGYGVWLMDNATVIGYGSISAPLHARPYAIADFTNDVKEDILWLGDDGHVELYTMNGLMATPAGMVRPAGTGFAPIAIGDFNHDGKADIVWAHADGTQSLWLMNGAAPLADTVLVGPGSGWSVVGVADLNGDAGSDLVWKATDGSYGGWTMAGTTRLDYRLWLQGGSGWNIVGTSALNQVPQNDLLWRHDDGSYGLWMLSGLDPTWTAVILNGGTGWELVP